MTTRYYHLEGRDVNEWYNHYDDAVEAYKELFETEPGLSLVEYRVEEGHTRRVWLAGSRR